MQEANSAEGSQEEETEQQRFDVQYLDLENSIEPHQFAKEYQEGETEQQGIISDLKMMNLDTKLTCAREEERNSNSSKFAHLCDLIPTSRLKNLPGNLSR